MFELGRAILPDTSSVSPRLTEVMAVIERRTNFYTATQLKLAVRDVTRQMSFVDKVRLRDLTAMVALGPDIDLYIAYSFDSKLIAKVTEIATRDLGVTVEEQNLYRDDSASEMVNIIVGNSTADLAVCGQALRLSPPVVIQGAKCLHPHADAAYATLTFRFEDGNLDVIFVGPRPLFDDQLNFRGGV
jgi:CheY-specific phosphatase CheX